MAIDKKISNSLFVIKAFAIISVIAAHMSFTAQYPVSENIRIAFGQIGVAIFFIISGFFFKRENGDSKSFWLKKAKTVVIPWIVCAVGTFVVSIVLRSSKGNLAISFVKWIFGVGNWYWYIPVLLILFVIFKYIKSDAMLYLTMALTFASLMLSAFGKIPYGTVFNQYLNVFNWMGLFALGIIIRKYNLLNKLLSTPMFVSSFIALVLSTFSTVGLNNPKAYTNVYSLIVELSAFVLFFNVSYYVSELKILQDIGKKSYLIYLIHMQIAGIINTRLPYNPVLFVLRPIIVLAVVYILVKVLELFLKKTGLIKYGYLVALGK